MFIYRDLPCRKGRGEEDGVERRRMRSRERIVGDMKGTCEVSVQRSALAKELKAWRMYDHLLYNASHQIHHRHDVK